MNESEPLRQACELFGLDPESPRALEALTHPSFAHEVRGARDNQRLEFLGDAVLDFVASAFLFEQQPDADEGELTRLRARVVSTSALSEFAKEHQIGPAIRFGRGASQGQLTESENVLADAVEALLAAAYLDLGLEGAKTACEKIVAFGLRVVPEAGTRDPKSELQERVQALGLRAPVYDVTERAGPAHDTLFTIVVRVSDIEVGRGQGRSKRTAEREAAINALELQTFEALANPPPKSEP